MARAEARAAWQLPLQWPQAAARRDAVASPLAGRLLKAALLFAMLALTVLDRFGLRVTAEGSVPVGLLAMYGLGAAMLLGGLAELNLPAALAYVALASVAGASLVVNAAAQPPAFLSAMSFLLLVTLYAPLALALRPEAVTPRLWRWTMDLFLRFALLVAFAGIAQYFVQFVFNPSWLFDYTPLIPERIQATRGFNTVYAVQAASAAWTKANGFFMREPSIFSVMMAFALLCELSLARRRWAMASFALALVLSYSGSGLLTLAAGLLFPLGWRTVARIVGAAAVGIALFVVLGDALNLSYTVDRFDEVGSRNSSAYCRFVYPGVAALEQLDSSLWTSLVGHGPGSMEKMGADCRPGGQTTYAKALFEYGIVGAFAFGALMFGALNRSGAPLRIRVGAAVAWLLLGGNLLDSLYLLFIYIVSAMWPPGIARRPPAP